MEFMMKKIESYSCIAPKISGTGNIEYCLWVALFHLRVGEYFHAAK